jgi:hypothetical protein
MGHNLIIISTFIIFFITLAPKKSPKVANNIPLRGIPIRAKKMQNNLPLAEEGAK